jgi:hypothetical protein
VPVIGLGLCHCDRAVSARSQQALDDVDDVDAQATILHVRRLRPGPLRDAGIRRWGRNGRDGATRLVWTRPVVRPGPGTRQRNSGHAR